MLSYELQLQSGSIVRYRDTSIAQIERELRFRSWHIELGENGVLLRACGGDRDPVGTWRVL